MRKISSEDLTKRQLRAARLPRLPLYLVLDNVRSMWNVGSMFRTADGAGIARVLLCGYTARPPRPEIAKTALGAEKAVPWEAVQDPAKALTQLQRQGIPVYVLEQTDGGVSLWDVELRPPLALVVGNEVEGVSPHVVSLADGAIEIPLFGVKESLNVAVACGVALFELARRFRRTGGGDPGTASV
jgi:tRNA G18 (ribose-2'-O)-methylase SpoU